MFWQPRRWWHKLLLDECYSLNHEDNSVMIASRVLSINMSSIFNFWFLLCYFIIDINSQNNNRWIRFIGCIFLISCSIIPIVLLSCILLKYAGAGKSCTWCDKLGLGQTEGEFSSLCNSLNQCHKCLKWDNMTCQISESHKASDSPSTYPSYKNLNKKLEAHLIWENCRKIVKQILWIVILNRAPDSPVYEVNTVKISK